MPRRRPIELIVTGALLATAVVAGAAETITYTYDAKGRLVQVTHSGTVNDNLVTNYTYDAADNRRNLNVTGAP